MLHMEIYKISLRFLPIAVLPFCSALNKRTPWLEVIDSVKGILIQNPAKIKISKSNTSSVMSKFQQIMDQT